MIGIGSCEITSYGSKNRNPEGKIVENLGSCRAPGTDILAIVKSLHDSAEFPEKVIRQATLAYDHVLDADRWKTGLPPSSDRHH